MHGLVREGRSDTTDVMYIGHLAEASLQLLYRLWLLWILTVACPLEME